MPEFPCPPGDICRPTFWNIPGFLQVIVYLGGLLAVIILVYGFWQRFQTLRKGKGKFDWRPLGPRLKMWLTNGVLTKKVVLDIQPAGVMHAAIMWGMVVLFIVPASYLIL